MANYGPINSNATYQASVAQKNEILGIGMALQDITGDDHTDYGEHDLNQLIARIDVLTRQLRMHPRDRSNILEDINLSQGVYHYSDDQPLSTHLEQITIAYQRLTNIALKH